MYKHIYTIVFLLLFSCVYMNARAQDTLRAKNSVKDTAQVQKKYLGKGWKIINNPTFLWFPYAEIHLGAERNLNSTDMIGIDLGWSWISLIKNYDGNGNQEYGTFIGSYFKKYISPDLQMHPYHYWKTLLFYRYEKDYIVIAPNDSILPTHKNYAFLDPDTRGGAIRNNPETTAAINSFSSYQGFERINTLAFEFLYGQDNSLQHTFYFSWYMGVGFRVGFKKRWINNTESSGISWVIPTVHAGMLIGLRVNKQH